MPVVASPQDFRERTEELERASLSSWATLALETKGRDRYEADDPLCTVFQSDRDRITGCLPWRRLAGKSAVLPARAGRSRLDEALDVVRVARTLARALRLNEDLAEAVALGQPLGSTPYGPAGEEAVELATGQPYRREEQALRTVEQLCAGGAGLNLTWETRDGILHQRWEGPSASTLEGEVARFARRIVEVSSTIGDARTAGLPAEVPQALAGGHRQRLQRMCADVATSSRERPMLSMSPPLADAQQAVHDALAPRVRATADTAAAHARAVHCVASVAVFALEGGAAPGREPVDTSQEAVVDAVAGATDAELIARYRAAFEPRSAPPNAI